MSLQPSNRPNAVALTAAMELELTRRLLLARMAAGAGIAGAALSALYDGASAQGSPVPAEQVDQGRLQGLIDLSTTICGGGNFNPDQAALLVQLLDGDNRLRQGLDELLATTPVEGGPPASAPAQAAMQAILLFWYVGSFNGEPIANRGTAYYQLTAWQAMYTVPVAICKAFGSWAEEPPTTALVPGS